MIQEFNGMVPVVDETAYVHPLAVVIGHVTIGKDCYVGPGAVIRGDWGRITVSDGCNIQENCVVHMFPGVHVTLGVEAHIGHGAIIHGAQLGSDTLVGMNSVLMDDVVLGDGCIVGAMSFLKAKSVWAPRSLVVGNPAEVRGEVSDAMLAHKKEGTALYRSLPSLMRKTALEVVPDRTVPESRPANFPQFETWQDRKDRS